MFLFVDPLRGKEWWLRFSIDIKALRAKNTKEHKFQNSFFYFIILRRLAIQAILSSSMGL